jgi:FkbM family methyltransferase
MPVEQARRLLKALSRYRDRALAAHRGGLPYLGRRRAKEALRAEFAGSWSGGYVMHGDGDAIYVPGPLDQRGEHVLFNPPAAHPLALRFVGPGSVVLDVGANIGEWSLPLARAVGPEGRVFSFEPIPAAADALTKTLRINNLPQGRVVRMAASDRAGTASFVVDAVDSGCSRIAEGGGLTVTTTTLDAFVAAEGLTRVALVKIDVEGHEAAVLKGAEATLAGLRPAVVMETGHDSPEARRAIAELMIRLRYDLVGLLLDHGVVEADWAAYRDGAAPFLAGSVQNLLLLPAAE